MQLFQWIYLHCKYKFKISDVLVQLQYWNFTYDYRSMKAIAN
jgi:hypothetical protein